MVFIALVVYTYSDSCEICLLTHSGMLKAIFVLVV